MAISSTSNWQQEMAGLGWPITVYTNPLTPYVYFDSAFGDEKLYEWIYAHAQPYFNFSERMPSSTIRSSAALEFLHQAILAERAKETAFLTWLRGKLSDIGIQEPSGDNWNEYIKIYNHIMQQDSEIQTLKNNLLNINDPYNHKTQTADIAKFLAPLRTWLAKLDDATKNINTQSNRIIANLTKESANWLSGELGNLKLDKAEGLALLMEMLYGKLEIATRQEPHMSWDKLQTSLNQSNEAQTAFYEQFKKVIEHFKSDPIYRKNLVDTWDLGTISPDSKNQNSQILSQISQLNDNVKEFVAGLQALFQRDNLDKMITLTNNASALSEVATAALHRLRDAFYSHKSGQSGSKADAIIAYLTISSEAAQQTNTELQKITKAINEYDSQMGQTNTKEYTMKQHQNYLKMKSKILVQLAAIQKKTKELVNCFIFEDSTKNYVSMGATIKGTVEDEFHGGSAGPNLGEQLAKIQLLSSTGQFSMPSINWLQALVINSGPGMIAANSKNALEEYLSIFVSFLLFNDFQTIAEDATKKLAENFPKSGVHQLHIFSLQNNYYPLSYLLQLTYERISGALSTVQVDSGAQATITGYVSQPTLTLTSTYYNSKKKENVTSIRAYYTNYWEGTAAQALHDTKIEITFLTNFAAVLQTILGK